MDWPQRIAEDPKLLTAVITCLSFIVIVVIGVGCCCICKATYVSTLRNPGDPCIRCQLIDMGEAACYTGDCPECGRIPPSSFWQRSNLFD